MSHESAYNRRLTKETKMDKVEGILDHLNLPPKVITFIRKHNRAILVAAVVTVAFIVFWALYGSYRAKTREGAASALSQAIQQDEDMLSESLENVIKKYKSTSSGLWAEVELAHLNMKKGDFDKASLTYNDLLSSLNTDNPLYPLVLYGLAQSQEAGKKYSDAADSYNKLKEIGGYENIGYMGLGRLEESQSNFEKAIEIYNNYILSMGDDPSVAQARAEITAKIARLKARQ